MATGSFQTSTTNLPLLTGYGILDREFRKQIGFTSPEFSALSILKALKREAKVMPAEETGRHSFYYYEQGDHLKARCTIASVSNTTINGTPTVLITLSSGDHSNSGVNSWPIKGNMAIFPNQTSGYVYDIDRATPSAHIVKVKSVTGTTDVQSAAVAGSEVVFAGVSVSEASSAVEHRNPQINKITQQIKTTRGKYQYTDHEGQNRTEVALSPDGKQYLHYLGIANTTEVFEMDEEYSHLFENINTATVTDLAGNAITSTLGLIPNVNANGQTQDYFGDVDLGTVQDWYSTLVANYGDGEYLCLNGINLGFGLMNWTADLGKYDASYLFFSGAEVDGKTMSGKEQAIAFNFTGIKMPGIGIETYFKDAKVFSHAGTMGSDKFPHKGMGVFIPAGSGLDPKTREMQPYLKVRWAMPGGSPHQITDGVQVWDTGANAQNGGNTDVLERNIHMVRYSALQAFNLRKFMVVTAGY